MLGSEKTSTSVVGWIGNWLRSFRFRPGRAGAFFTKTENPGIPGEFERKNMKKLVSVACALAAGIAMADTAVESANVVGYLNREATGGYSAFTAGFQKIGGGTTMLSDVIDTAQLMPYADDIQVYNGVDGTFTQWVWDGSCWTDWVNSEEDVELNPGSGYLGMLSGSVIVKGEVVNPNTLSYEHNVPQGYSVLASAFPVALKQSNFNFAEVLMPYGDDIQVYEPEGGTFTQWIWDGTGFTDWVGYYPDELAPAGQGIFFGNNSGFSGLVETLSAN